MDEFNGGDFFRCHETLEALWLKEDYPTRLFYQGILKMAVGFHHLQRRNKRGARAKLQEGMELLEPFQPRFMGARVGKLRRDAANWLQRPDAQGEGPVPVEDLPKIAYSRPTSAH